MPACRSCVCSPVSSVWRRMARSWQLDQAEVEHLDEVVVETHPAHVDVGRLDVAMHQPLRVRFGQRMAHLAQQEHGALGGHRTELPDQRLEVATVEQLHHVVERALAVMPKSNTWMVCGEFRAAVACASRSKRRSICSAPHRSPAPSSSGRTSLIAALPREQPMLGAPDFAHAAAARAARRDGSSPCPAPGAACGRADGTPRTARRRRPRRRSSAGTARSVCTDGGTARPRRCASHTPSGSMLAAISAAISILRGDAGVIMANDEDDDGVPRQKTSGTRRWDRHRRPLVQHRDAGRVQRHVTETDVPLVLRSVRRVPRHRRASAPQLTTPARIGPRDRGRPRSRTAIGRGTTASISPEGPQSGADGAEERQPLDLIRNTSSPGRRPTVACRGGPIVLRRLRLVMVRRSFPGLSSGPRRLMRRASRFYAASSHRGGVSAPACLSSSRFITIDLFMRSSRHDDLFAAAACCGGAGGPSSRNGHSRCRIRVAGHPRDTRAPCLAAAGRRCAARGRRAQRFGGSTSESSVNTCARLWLVRSLRNSSTESSARRRRAVEHPAAFPHRTADRHLSREHDPGCGHCRCAPAGSSRAWPPASGRTGSGPRSAGPRGRGTAHRPRAATRRREKTRARRRRTAKVLVRVDERVDELADVFLGHLLQRVHGVVRRRVPRQQRDDVRHECRVQTLRAAQHRSDAVAVAGAQGGDVGQQRVDVPSGAGHSERGVQCYHRRLAVGASR